MASHFVCKHCGRRYRRRKGQPFGRDFCSKKCFWNGQKISVKAIWERDHGTCHLCGGWVPIEEASRDHVKPRHHGGKTTWGNIKLAHRDCNSRRGHKDVKEYTDWWEDVLAERDRKQRNNDNTDRYAKG